MRGFREDLLLRVVLYQMCNLFRALNLPWRVVLDQLNGFREGGGGGGKSIDEVSPGPVKWFSGGVKSTQKGRPGPVEWFSVDVKSTEEGSAGPVEQFFRGV